MLRDNFKQQVQLHFIVFIWGFTAILGNLISLDALTLVWIRIFMALGVIAAYMFYTKSIAKLSPKAVAILIVSGFVIALHWITFFHAIKISNISITLACLSTGAFFTSILEPIFFKRKIIWYEILLGIVVVLGLLLIFSVEVDYVEGIIFALISAFLSASFSIINAKLVRKYNARNICFYEMIGGLLLLTITLFVSGGMESFDIQFKEYDFLWLLILSTICTAYPMIATIDIMKYLSPYTIMLSINLEPIYGICLAVLFFKDTEKMTPAFYLGAFIILGTVVLNAYFKNKAKKEINKI